MPLKLTFRAAAITMAVAAAGVATAQQRQSGSAVPRVVKVTGSFVPANGLAASPVESVTASLYRDELGGDSLWSETQNVPVAPDGSYTVFVGSGSPDGIPADILSAVDGLWLGLQFNRSREVEKRSRLVSVPFALQAANAEMLGGRPASAYVLAQPEQLLRASGHAARVGSGRPLEAASPRVASGTVNCISIFTTVTDLGCSTLWQANGNIGVGRVDPGYRLDVAGAALVERLKVDSDRINPYRFFSVTSYGSDGVVRLNSGPASTLFFNREIGAVRDLHIWDGMTNPVLVVAGATRRIGIGTTSPQASLDVASGGMAVRGVNYASAGYALELNMISGLGQVSAVNGSTRALVPLGIWGNPTTFYASGGIGAPVMSLTSSGNVGVGTGLPATKLDVAGQIRSSSGGFIFPDGTVQTTAATSAGGGGAASQWTSSAGAIFYNGGSVGIGTSAPASKLDVAGDINLTGNLKFAGVPAFQLMPASGNMGIGLHALESTTTGTNNTTYGYNSLTFNTTGNQNTASGGYALYANTTGSYNTAQGYGALRATTTGRYNTATGVDALGVTTAGYNSAHGALALASDTIGQNNTAAGYNALGKNTTGSQNTATGYGALASNLTGNSNTAAGVNALNGATGNNNIGIGQHAGYFITSGSNNIHIGHQGIAGDTARIRIGTPGIQSSFFASGIRGVTTADNDAVPVIIDSNGQLGTISSSRRFKEDVRDMGDASRAILRLRPVTFRYKQPFADGAKPVQYGLIAEEVAQVFPNLVARSADGQVETVKYQLLDAMLLNEVQRQHSEIEAHTSRIRTLEAQLASQQELNRELRDRLGKLEAALLRGNR